MNFWWDLTSNHPTCQSTHPRPSGLGLAIILASFLLQYKDQSCVTIYEDDTDSHKAGHWNDGDCIRELNYVCKGAASPDNPKPKSASCQKPGYENYSPYRDNCYWFSTVARTWSEAEKDCQSQGAHLMSVLDPSEQNFVFAHMHSEIIWIGLSGVEVKNFLVSVNVLFLPNSEFIYYWHFF